MLNSFPLPHYNLLNNPRPRDRRSDGRQHEGRDGRQARVRRGHARRRSSYSRRRQSGGGPPSTSHNAAGNASVHSPFINRLTLVHLIKLRCYPFHLYNNLVKRSHSAINVRRVRQQQGTILSILSCPLRTFSHPFKRPRGRRGGRGHGRRGHTWQFVARGSWR